MSGRRNEVTELLETLWGSNTQAWNNAQHKVADAVNNLFLETTTVTENDLMQRINKLVTQNFEAYGADESEDEEMPGNIRSVLDRNLRRNYSKTMTDNYRSQDHPTAAQLHLEG